MTLLNWIKDNEGERRPIHWPFLDVKALLENYVCSPAFRSRRSLTRLRIQLGTIMTPAKR